MSEKVKALEQAESKLKEAIVTYDTITGTTMFRMPLYSPSESRRFLQAAKEWLDDAVKQFQNEKYEEAYVSASNSIEYIRRAYNHTLRALESTVA